MEIPVVPEFTGHFPVVMDVKGRITPPAHLRRVISDHCEGRAFVITMDPTGQAARLFLPQTYEKVEQFLDGQREVSAGDIELKRLIAGTSTRCRFGAGGKIQVPKIIRLIADLKGPLVIIGMRLYLEIWSQQRLVRVLSERATRTALSSEPRTDIGL